MLQNTVHNLMKSAANDDYHIKRNQNKKKEKFNIVYQIAHNIFTRVRIT